MQYGHWPPVALFNSEFWLITHELLTLRPHYSLLKVARRRNGTCDQQVVGSNPTRLGAKAMSYGKVSRMSVDGVTDVGESKLGDLCI